jgi:putative FmdB family regulatory protein
MPTYDYSCPSCGAKWENARTMADRNGEKCSTCSVPAKIVITGGSTRVFVPFKDDSITGKMTVYTSKKQWDDDLKRNHMREVGGPKDFNNMSSRVTDCGTPWRETATNRS